MVSQQQGRARMNRAAKARPAWQALAAAALLAALAGCAGPQGGRPGSAAEASASRSPAAGAPDLVALASVAPDITQDMRYRGSHNFLGRPVVGYEAAQCWLSRPAAQALAAVQREVAPLGLRVKVFDCYRPQRAVDDFVRWGRDLQDQKTKAAFYPRVPKEELFQRGYIAERSGHSRASTVDMTLVVLDGVRARSVLAGPLADGQEADMGTPFDLFDELSHTDNAELPPDVQHNRHWLRALMQRHGWRNLPEEWWHFTLEREPYPDRFFDVPLR